MTLPHTKELGTLIVFQASIKNGSQSTFTLHKK